MWNSLNYVELLNLFLLLCSEPIISLTMCAGAWIQLPVICFNHCIALLYHFRMYMLLEIRKMKKFKITQSTNWLKKGRN